ncbi:MAG: ATP-binding protein [Flavobacterium sp.]|uniref:sensor histidine kinase n=1 Tax=Flavobacterium sp. TaxID=239 RepID=UPI003265D3C1
MLIPQKHKNETERLKLLESYSILDTLPETDFDNITAIASQICNIPISLITLLDSDRQWFKSHHGLEVTETPREHAFCAHAIHDTDTVFIIEDARNDERFHDNPLVTGYPNVIFYAGVPLTNNAGLPLGTLCVIDNKPNVLNEAQLKALKSLANQVMNLLELRRNKIYLEQAMLELELRNQELEKFAYVAAHDLKSPLNNISALTNLLKENYTKEIDTEGINIVGLIQSSSNQLRGLIDGLLDNYKLTNIIHSRKTEINLEKLKGDLDILFSFESNCVIRVNSYLEHIYANKTAIDQILINLVSNAIKYNNKYITEIELKVRATDDLQYEIIVVDNGPGIAEEHHDKIFQIFETLSDKDQFGNQGNGIGLATVKKIVENLGGKIHVESELGKGSSFVFTINI